MTAIDRAASPLVIASRSPVAERRIESTTLHMVGLAVLAVAGATAAGSAVGLVADEPHLARLVVSTMVLGVVGAALWAGTVTSTRRETTSTAMHAVAITWIVISAAAAVPYVIVGTLPWDLALFESVSGLTGTGSTVLAPIEGSGEGLLFYRQASQWIGGMGVIVLAVAVLPFLGIGGLSLLRAESPGPTDDRLSVRVSETARRLWAIYVGLTALSTLVLLACGMSVYDAVSHAMTGVGTGGFSPYNDSISHFDSAVVEAGIMVSMFLGAVKFPLFWAAITRRDLGVFWRSAEFRFFTWILLGSIGAVTYWNAADGQAVVSALRGASFNVISLVSSCGFGTDDFTQWVAGSQIVLLFLMVTGSMAGSTSGALKLFRVQVAVKHAWREVRRIRHPRAILPIRLGSERVPEDIVRSVLGYVMFYFVIAVAGIVALAAFGADLPTSAGSVVTAMGGIGPGLGATGPAANFLVVDGASRAVLIALMLLGRLEIFPLLALVLPATRFGPRQLRSSVLGQPRRNAARNAE